MDEYFFHSLDFQGDEALWFDDALPPPAVHQCESAFVDYSRQTLQGFRSRGCGNHGHSGQNVHKRMIEFLKKCSESMKMKEAVEAERERNHKHMINERMRRVKQKQSFLELHKLLPQGTKNDKNSIVQTASETIEELQRDMEAQKRRKLELEMALAEADHANDNKETMEEAKIRLRVAHPSSGIDSMLEALKCLKNTGTKTTALQSIFTSQEFSAVLHIESKRAAEEIEKELHKALHEVERKFRCA